MPLRATPAQRRALYRLPLSKETISRDTRRLAMWQRLVELGWAKWDGMGTLYRSDAGTLACCRSQQAWEDELSSQLEAADEERYERGELP